MGANGVKSQHLTFLCASGMSRAHYALIGSGESIPENPLPGVATAAHMIDGILKLDSQRPGHAPVLTKPPLMSNVEI